MDFGSLLERLLNAQLDIGPGILWREIIGNGFIAHPTRQHFGDRYPDVTLIAAGASPVLVDDAMRTKLEALTDLAPLHNPPALAALDAAARAVEMVGLPEAALNLAHAVVYLATAPKSNRVTVALGRARDDVRSGLPAQVPAHLRDAHYRGAAAIGHGAGYRYPHDFPGGWIAQQYRPDAFEGHVYYEPSGEGTEREVSDRLRRGDRGLPRTLDRSEGDRPG